MQIAYVVNSFGGGGAEFPIPAIVRQIESQGHKVKVYGLTRREGLLIEAMEAANVKWACCEGHKKAHFKAWRWLKGQLREDKPDIIWTSLNRSAIIGQRVGKALGIPVISWQHNSRIDKMKYRILKRQKNIVKLWVADSDVIKAQTIERFSLPQDSVHIIPLFKANTQAPKAAAWQKGEAFKFVSLGRLHPNKGYDILIKALALLDRDGLPDFEINIAGIGEQEAPLKALCAELKVDDINFVGFKKDIPDYLAQHHAYLQPSHNEGLCIAAHEGMLAGLPILATPVGQLAHSVSPERGWRLGIADPASIAAVMRECLLSAAQVHVKGEAARDYVLENYSEDAFNRSITSILAKFEKIIA